MADDVIEKPKADLQRSQRNNISAEARRAARRNKILQNREERLQRILGPNSEAAAQRIVASSASIDDDPVLPEEFLTLDFVQKAKAQKPSFDSNNRPLHLSSTSTSHRKNYRIVLMILGTLLPFICSHYFLVYFFMFEAGVFMYYRRMPVPPASTNIIFTLILLVGLKEQDVARLKRLLQFGNWIFKDICLFYVVSSVIPYILTSAILVLYPQG